MPDYIYYPLKEVPSVTCEGIRVTSKGHVSAGRPHPKIDEWVGKVLRRRVDDGTTKVVKPAENSKYIPLSVLASMPKNHLDQYAQLNEITGSPDRDALIKRIEASGKFAPEPEGEETGATLSEVAEASLSGKQINVGAVSDES